MSIPFGTEANLRSGDALSQCLVCDAVSPLTTFVSLAMKNWQCEDLLSLPPMMYPVAKFCFPSLLSLNSARLKVFVPNGEILSTGDPAMTRWNGS